MELKSFLAGIAIKGAAHGGKWKMCRDCAFKAGTEANEDYEATQAAMQALVSGASFNCHTNSFQDAGCACAGYLYALQYFSAIDQEK
jgi:hypothetical protein